jgi:hypothetical protein
LRYGRRLGSTADWRDSANRPAQILSADATRLDRDICKLGKDKNYSTDRLPFINDSSPSYQISTFLASFQNKYTMEVMQILLFLMTQRIESLEKIKPINDSKSQGTVSYVQTS